MKKYLFLTITLLTLLMQGFVNAQDEPDELTTLQKVRQMILELVPDSAGLANTNQKVDSLNLVIDSLKNVVDGLEAGSGSNNPDSLNDLPGAAYMLKNDSTIFASRFYTDQQLLSKSNSNHNHSGVYEPIISKETGYLRYNGSSWGFLNETYEPVKGSNDNYVSDAQLIVIGNTLGVNTGDNATNSQYSGLAASKQNTLVSGTNIKTINGSSMLGSGNLSVTATLDTPTVNGIIDKFLADSAYSSIYTGTETDSLLTLAGNAIQSAALNTLAEFDTQIGISGTASATTYWRGDNSWATLPTIIDTLIHTFAIIDTVIAGSLPGWKVPYDITILEVASYTDANTVTFNLEERGEATPNTSGTDVMTSDLVADNNQQETTTFTNASIAKDAWLVPSISATGDVTIFSVTVRYVKVY